MSFRSEVSVTARDPVLVTTTLNSTGPPGSSITGVAGVWSTVMLGRIGLAVTCDSGSEQDDVAGP